MAFGNLMSVDLSERIFLLIRLILAQGFLFLLWCDTKKDLTWVLKKSQSDDGSETLEIYSKKDSFSCWSLSKEEFSFQELLDTEEGGKKRLTFKAKWSEFAKEVVIFVCKCDCEESINT